MKLFFKKIGWFFWFIKESKPYMEMGYYELIRHNNCIPRAFEFVDYMTTWYKLKDNKEE